MPNPRMKQRRVVHKSTAGILKPIPEAVDLVGNPPPGLTTKTVAPLQQRGTANRRSDPSMTIDRVTLIDDAASPMPGATVAFDAAPPAAASGAPQSPQNFFPEGLSEPHLAHRIGRILRVRRSGFACLL